MITCKTEWCYNSDKTSVAFISKFTFEKAFRTRLTGTGDNTTWALEKYVSEEQAYHHILAH